MIEPGAALEAEGLRAGGCIDGFSLRLGAGERVVLLGENGVGKTTLLRALLGLGAPAAGVVRASGPIGYVAQDYRASLLPWLRVSDNVALPLLARGDDRAAISRQVEEAAGLAQLPTGALARFPYALSGGEQQRVALARALVDRPRLLVLDEPLAALDAAARIATRARLSDFAARSGCAILLVTHDLDDALEIGGQGGRAIVVGGRPMRALAEVALGAGGREALRSALSPLAPGPAGEPG